MIFHTEFFAKGRKHTWLAELFRNTDLATDGGFSRVVRYSNRSALKATCCKATNLLLETLWGYKKVGAEVPHNLPAVFQKYGPALTDRENFTFSVWEVEQLFKAEDLDRQKIARATGRKQMSRYKPGYRSQVSALTTNSLGALQRRLEEEQDRFRGYGDWTASANIAVAMISRTEGNMRDTFVFLKAFVEKHKVHLDLLGTGNILVNMFGEPCLCDAVSDTFEGDPPLSLAPGTVAVVAEVPIKVSGMTVLTQYRASPPISHALAIDISKVCEAQGLVPAIVQWGSPELIARLTESVKTKSVWDFPSAVTRLRRNEYAKALGQ
jgi:hypothetical protein